jgi:hypothetical protein
LGSTDEVSNFTSLAAEVVPKFALFLIEKIAR